MVKMREIVLDTETTGLDAKEGDRIVEIGCIEIIDQRVTGRSYHQYINPERAMPTAAFEVHGLGDEFLGDKPVFTEIAAEFIEFLGDANLVIHNAKFDMEFLNCELQKAGRQEIEMDRAIDTVELYRKKHPGQRASLDAICRHFRIDSSRRVKHGALLDAELLAEVYLELTGGRQKDMLTGVFSAASGKGNDAEDGEWRPEPRQKPLPSRLTDSERKAHEMFVGSMGPDALWNKFN